eukprot:6196934-Pleurochrysis_carterae.AAC.6
MQGLRRCVDAGPHCLLGGQWRCMRLAHPGRLADLKCVSLTSTCASRRCDAWIRVLGVGGDRSGGHGACSRGCEGARD